MIPAQLYGLVLTGGRSSRMGIDKGLMEYHRKPQREHLFNLLTGFCEKVFTSCRKKQGIPQSLHPIHDRYEWEVPLNGILSAFHYYPDKAWLTVAVDLPFIDDNALNYLIGQRDPTRMATCLYDYDGHLPEPLFSIWEPLCLAELRTFQSKGGLSPREFLARSDIKILQPPNPSWLLNVNTKEDLDIILAKFSP